MFPQTSAGYPEQVPPKVQAAQNYLHFAHAVMSPISPGMLPGDSPRSEGELSAKEKATYDAALEVLRMYFHGEMDYGDPNSGRPMQVDWPEDPQNPVPAS